MKRSLIVARSRNGIIGHANGLPWRLPADLAFFKKTTMGKPVVMGRKTFEAIGRVLPGRQNIVVTRTPGYAVPGATVVDSLEAAFRETGDAPEVFVIGGAQIYEAALPSADFIYLTEVEADIEGDTAFPPLDMRQWRASDLGSQPVDERHAYALRFLRLERIRR